MDVAKISLLGIIAVVVILLTRQLKPEFATILTIAFSVVIVVTLADDLFEVVYAFYSIAETTNIEQDSLFAVIKIIGIGYISEFSNSICVEANCKSLGDKIILAGKIAIMLISIPIVSNILTIILQLVP